MNYKGYYIVATNDAWAVRDTSEDVIKPMSAQAYDPNGIVVPLEDAAQATENRFKTFIRHYAVALIFISNALIAVVAWAQGQYGLLELLRRIFGGL